MTDTEKWSRFARKTTADALLSYANFRNRGDVHELSERILMGLLKNAVELGLITAREMAQVVVRMSADIQKEELETTANPCPGMCIVKGCRSRCCMGEGHAGVCRCLNH